MKLISIFILFAAFIFTFMTMDAQPPKYNATLLLQDQSNLLYIHATNLNNLGEVVGYYIEQNDDFSRQAFLCSNGKMIELGTLGGNRSYAYDINDLGQIVGNAETLSGGEHAFLYSNGTMVDLGTLNGTDTSFAIAINNISQVVGGSSSTDLNKPSFSVIFWQGNIINIGSLPGSFNNSFATRINDYYSSNGFGQIIGESSSGKISSSSQGFLYANGTLIDIGSKICPNNYSSYSALMDINNLGQVVGYCTDDTQTSTSAFLYDSENETTYFISETGRSQALGINDASQVIGTDKSSNITFSFLFMNGVKYNLEDLIVSTSNLSDISVVAINNKGQIVANTLQGIVLLTPIPANDESY